VLIESDRILWKWFIASLPSKRAQYASIFNGRKRIRAKPFKEELIMVSLALQSLVLADGITIQIGSHAWNFSSSFIVYLIVAAIVGIVAELIVGWRLPFGIVGAIIAGLIGVWLMTQVIIISGLPDFTIDGVPIIRALIGALILVAIWHALTYPAWRRRRRYYRR
jgi:uncharacterized membrane protein YeaQ/YmgE (transglycosylase-associated protein family)